MENDENKKAEHFRVEAYLDELYKHLKSVREETITRLGRGDALHIIDFHGNNWIDMHSWISSKYAGEEGKQVGFFQFLRLFKEIYWLQFLFHHGNYPMIYRTLRYILELIAQSYYVDSQYPNLSLDEKMEKTEEIEESVYGWSLVKVVLCEVSDSTEESIRSNFKPLWDYLNKHTHPSAKQMDIVATEDFSSLITDSFNKNLATNVLRVTNEIFDLVNMIIVRQFSMAKESILQYKFINEWDKYLPNTMRLVRG
jgi:hypothetical protein